jgi:hypothetical protein
MRRDMADLLTEWESAMRKILFLCGISFIGCGGGSSTGSDSFGLAAPATGPITMQNSNPDKPISGLIFENQGTGNITVDQIHTVLVGGQGIESSAGVGVQAGNKVTYLFDSQSPQTVDSISFVVHGATEVLAVLETQETGVVPSNGGTHKCVGGTAGQPSPAGGCCSEWIPCQQGLACQPDGPVYPGSLGICAGPSQGDCSDACPSGEICCFVWGVGGPSSGANQCLTPDSASPTGNGCPINI